MTIAWLSGSSDPRRCALSPAETALLEAAAAGRRVVRANFPWPDRPGPFRTVALPLASVRNAVQFWRARLSRRYRAFVATRIMCLPGDGDLVLITGSQGLELLRLAWPLLGDTGRIRVVALGPVAGRLPAGLRPFVIRSSTDVVSRLGWRGPVDVQCAAGHLDYAAEPQVRAAVADAVGAAR